MTYDEQKIKMGKQPVYVLEMDIKTCTLQYGIAPCTAPAVAPGFKCFNTLKTCPVQNDYIQNGQGLTTYRFSSLRIDTLQEVGGPPTFPTIMKMDNAPAKLQPGKGLGIRSSAKITLMDHPWTDRGVDPYVDERTYDPDTQGTFWGKFLARNPYYENDVVRVKQGYLNDDGSYSEDNMVTREYLLSRISGPDKSGRVVIECKDILKFADGVKSQIPSASRATLVNLIPETGGGNTFDINDSTGQIFEAFNLAPPFGPQEYIIIEEEIIKMTNVQDLTGGVYRISFDNPRNEMPSYYEQSTNVRVEHEAGTLVQACWNIDNLRLDDILRVLLELGAGIPQNALDLVGWETVMSFGLTNYNFSTLIIEPLSVKQLIEEISEYTVFFWWHERDKLVKMSSLLEKRLTTLDVFSDDLSLLANTVTTTKDTKQRVSQVWMYYGHRSPLLDMDKLQYFKKLKIEANLDKETDLEYGTPAYKKIFSRWLTSSQDVIANEVSSRLLAQYDETKTILTAEADPKNDDLWTGSLLNVSTQFYQNEFGENVFGSYLILQVTEQNSAQGTKFKYLMQEWNQALGRFGVITPNEDPDNPGNPFPDYTPSSDDQKDRYAFIGANAIPAFPDDTRWYQIF